MKSWSEWEILRHRVGIGGQVLDARHRPLSGVRLDLAGLQKQTVSRADGRYFFMDCPAGTYTVTAMDERSGVRAEQTIVLKGDAVAQVEFVLRSKAG